MAAATSSLTSALVQSPHAFLQPSLPLYTDSLAYLKHALDSLAADVSVVQQDRLQQARKKRKRSEKGVNEDVLRLKQIHTAGFTVDQIWEQARRVIDAAGAEVRKDLENAEIREAEHPQLLNGVNGDAEEDWEESSAHGELGEEGLDYEVEGPDGDEEDFSDVDEAEGVDGDALDDLDRDEDMSMDEDDFSEKQLLGNSEPPAEFVADKFGLNDGFFSIDDFNRQSEFLEQQDARGEDDGAASDEEDVDFDADPLASGGQADDQNGAENETEEDDEDGPTFGDPDAASEDEDDELAGGEMDDMGGMSNTNHIMYADFFAPPAQKKRKNRKGKPNPHNFPAQSQNAPSDAEDDQMEQIMAKVHRDLLEDDESQSEEDEERGEVDPSDPKSRRSTHERRKAALAEEIRKLEAESVAKREWTLSGEARAIDRPMNSLLEEDLDFERAGKPVPVITAEASESIEDLIKRRILAFDFQDIIRRRPDDLATGRDARKGRLDIVLDDNRSKKGLAEEYEEEHLRRTDPNYVDAKDEKTKKEEKEIEALWKKVSGDLDSLSSWHFRPKQPAPQLDIRVDAPAISMEDARPGGGGEVATTSQLAPQEVYRAGEAAKGVREEVVGKSGLPSGREEMNRDEKKRRRRREKERLRKAAGNDDRSNDMKARNENKAVKDDLKKGGVRVVGKKGEITDVEGREVKASSDGQRGAGRFKL